MIEIRNVSFSYPGGVSVVNNISVAFPEGKVTAVLGPNGAGKTTLFKCMLGLLTHYDGQISIDGKDLCKMPPAERAAYIAYIPQRSAYESRMLLRDFVVMGSVRTLSLTGVPGSKQKKAAEDAISALGLEPIADRPVYKLSGGEKQMALIARALCQQSKTLLMDEPDTSLDPGHVSRVLSAIDLMTGLGQTVILSTHRPEYADRYTSEVVLMKKGNIIASGPSGNVMTGELLSELYDTEVRVITADGQRFIRTFP